MAMLLANMAKSDSIERLLTLKRDVILGLSTSKIAIDQLMDCFVKGAKGSYDPKADYDYLAYLFADLAKVQFSSPCFFNGRQIFTSVVPQSPRIPHHNSSIRQSLSIIKAPAFYGSSLRLPNPTTRRSIHPEKHRLLPLLAHPPPLTRKDEHPSLHPATARRRQRHLHRLRDRATPRRATVFGREP